MFKGIKSYLSFQRELLILRKMNIISDQQGIINRYLREKQGWDEHLNNSKNFILSCVTDTKEDSVALLGSGWLLDIPLEKLSEQFNKVYLIDINHPAQIQHKARKYGNVFFVKKDITGGGLHHAYHCVRTFKRYKKKLPIESFEKLSTSFSLDFNFVVSLNILSQLDILIVDYLKKYNIYSDSEIIKLKKIIQEQHFKFLPKKKSCLIADVEELLYDKDYNFLDSNPTVYVEIPKSNFSAFWIWKFDSKMYYYPKKRTFFKVVALKL